MRNLLKNLAAKVPADSWERLLSYSVLNGPFSALGKTPAFSNRELLWDACLLEHAAANGGVTFVEFGVHEGYSMRHFSARNTSPASTFTGLDSFEGLPEAWGSMPKGSFDVNGSIPSPNDSRVHYIKGWFQDTSGLLLQRLAGREAFPLIVHYDADLYSSTLFALTQIARLNQPYLAIFDEFTGHESRALYNFSQAFYVDVNFLGKTLWKGTFPQQVLCRITPRGPGGDGT